MPSKKKKYNARFPAGRIKKIMQTDEEVGKVAQAVPVIISRTLELFVESLLTKAMEITSAKNAKTLSPSHMKQCILSESRFDFLKDLVKSLPDVTACDSEDGTVQPNASSQPSNSVGRPDTASAGIRKSQEGYSLMGAREDRSPAAAGGPQQTTVVSNRVTPNFYKENDEGTAVQSAPETQDMEDDSEDEGEEIRTPTIAPQFIPPPQISSVVDEDYDT